MSLLQNAANKLRRKSPTNNYPLSAYGMIQRAYQILGSRKGSYKFKFADLNDLSFEDPWFNMANAPYWGKVDDNVKRTRENTAFMSYSEASIVPIKDQNWILARGTLTGITPPSNYEGELFAQPFNNHEALEDLTQLTVDIKASMQSYISVMFQNLIYAKIDGSIHFSKAYRPQRLNNFVGKEIENLKTSSIDQSNQVLYHPESALLLATGIEQTLIEANIHIRKLKIKNLEKEKDEYQASPIRIF